MKVSRDAAIVCTDRMQVLWHDIWDELGPLMEGAYRGRSVHRVNGMKLSTPEAPILTDHRGTHFTRWGYRRREGSLSHLAGDAHRRRQRAHNRLLELHQREHS